MSRKQPEIKVTYPDASPAAMLLTEAMIKRSSGKRVVETNSEEKEYTGQELFAGALACKTDTSVELTLRLNPDAMDYALTTLIAKNLTEEERRAVRAATDSMEVEDLLSPRAGEAAGAGTCTEEVRSASRADEAIDVPLPPAAQPTDAETQSGKPEKIIEVGKITETELRGILVKMLINYETFDPDSTEPIDIAINEMNYAAGEAAGAGTCTEEVAKRIQLHEKVKTQSAEPEKIIEVGKIKDRDLRSILNEMVSQIQTEDVNYADAIDTAVNEINYRAGVIEVDETYKPDPLILKRDIEAIIQGSLQDNIPSLEHHNIVIIADDMARRLNLHTQIECDPNMGYDRNCIEIAIATLICAAQEKDWSREDLAAWADHIIAMLNPNDFTHASEPSYLATKDISMYIAKGEIQLGLKDIDTAKRLSEELHQEAYQERNKDRQVAEQTKPAKKARKKKSSKQDDSSWDDVEKEARKIGQHKTDKTDKTDKGTEDREIEPGLLNDIEDGEEGEEE